MEYINDLSSYIHQEMDFLIVRMLSNAFDYENKIEAIKKRKDTYHEQANMSNIWQEFLSRL